MESEHGRIPIKCRKCGISCYTEIMPEHTGTRIINTRWLIHMAAEANDDGIWVSTPDSRAALPYTDGWSDRAIQKRLQKLHKDGKIRRISKGNYSVL